jgi:hypothetical protein
MLGLSSWGVQVGGCESLVSILWWSQPPHHVKGNPLGEVHIVDWTFFLPLSTCSIAAASAGVVSSRFLSVI